MVLSVLVHDREALDAPVRRTGLRDVNDAGIEIAIFAGDPLVDGVGDDVGNLSPVVLHGDVREAHHLLLRKYVPQPEFYSELAVVADLRSSAAGVSLRVSEGASERLAVEVADRSLAQAVVTEPVNDSRLVVEHLLDEDLVALVPIDLDLGHEVPVPLTVLARHPMVLPPVSNPLRREIDDAARAEGITLRVPLEVEGVRLIPDLVSAGVGVAIMPETAVPPDDPMIRALPIAGMPPRRLALVSARGVRLSLADQAVREAIIRLVRATRG